MGLFMVNTANAATATDNPAMIASRTISLSGFISFWTNFMSIIFTKMNKNLLNTIIEMTVSIYILKGLLNEDNITQILLSINNTPFTKYY